MRKPSELYEDGEVELKDKTQYTRCLDCGEKAEQYIWSPHFCPECDLIRMDGIHSNMIEIRDNFREKMKKKG